MRNLLKNSMQVALSFAFFAAFAVKSDQCEVSFITYAKEFRSAVVSRDERALRRLVGNDRLLDDVNRDFALGAGAYKDGSSLREFLVQDDVFYLIDGVESEAHSGAMIYFVRDKGLRDSRIVGGWQLRGKVLLEDYVACEVVRGRGGIFMPDHLCFFETDLIDNEEAETP